MSYLITGGSKAYKKWAIELSTTIADNHRCGVVAPVTYSPSAHSTRSLLYNA